MCLSASSQRQGVPTAAVAFKHAGPFADGILAFLSRPRPFAPPILLDFTVTESFPFWTSSGLYWTFCI